MKAIEVNGLKKYYNKHRGIEDVTLSVDQGEIYGFVGPNGAGKSTTIKILLNFVFPTAGTGFIMGKDIVSQSKEIKKFTAYVPSDVRLYHDMTSAEIFSATSHFYGLNRTEEISRLTRFFDVDPNKKIRELSLGNKKKTAIISALIPDPEVILLDEPTNGLDPVMQKRLFEELKRRSDHGCSIFLSSHNLTEIQEYCDQAAFIKEGVITHVIDLKMELRHQKIVRIKPASPISFQPDFPIKMLSQNEKEISFLFDGEINQLTALLAGADLLDFSVQERSLEDQFMEMYQEAGTNGNIQA